MVQKAPKPHFWVILTHFGIALGVLLGPIIRIKAPKMGPIWGQIGFSKCLLRHVNAGKGHFWSYTLPWSHKNVVYLTCGTDFFFLQ